MLAVDAGNSKTIALVVRVDGEVLGAGRAGNGDIYGASSADHALTEVTIAVETALQRAGAAPGDLAVGAFSMAGADWPEDFAYLKAAMDARGFGRSVLVVNDAIGALRAGTSDGFGVVVACGTGIATAARSRDGRVWHSGFWQESNGGYELGRRALQAVYRAELGIDPPTSLRQPLLAAYDEPDVERLLHRLTARGVTASLAEIARLAPILLDAADAGDPAALRIVQEQAVLLADYARAAARRVGIAGSPYPLVLAGGVLRHPSSHLVDGLLDRLRAAGETVTPIECPFEPVAGAVFLGLEAIDVAIEQPLIDRLVSTLPPPSFFAS